ncbi:unnamed protein product [Schistosoma mattheei]|uniref:Uncharacterized protein n=1 Tax=Schistosoma mattheei TaxID=31246 RepID=A0A183PG71_9TREM|nr:unnamed protein product [Schistosoma mattheei]
MNIIQFYAPNNDYNEDAKDQFYDGLQSIGEKCPTKDPTILMGDLNAEVGMDNTRYEDIMGRHGLGERNENGERFANLCDFNKLVIGGTIFPHKRIHKITWTSPDHTTQNQIDHFCINETFRRTMEDVRTKRGADITSDHHLLVTKMKLKLKKYWTTGRTISQKFNTTSLRDTDKLNEFKIVLSKKFQVFHDLHNGEGTIMESNSCFFSHYLVYNTTSNNHSNTDKNNHNSEIAHQPNLLLISLNGLIWYQGNILAGTNDPDPLGQLNWLRKTFEWARKRKDKVLLVSHFPPGASENAPQWYQFLRPEINDQFVNILIDNADLLMTGLFAHEHVDSFRLLVSKSS